MILIGPEAVSWGCHRNKDSTNTKHSVPANISTLSEYLFEQKDKVIDTLEFGWQMLAIQYFTFLIQLYNNAC